MATCFTDVFYFYFVEHDEIYIYSAFMARFEKVCLRLKALALALTFQTLALRLQALAFALGLSK